MQILPIANRKLDSGGPLRAFWASSLGFILTGMDTHELSVNDVNLAQPIASLGVSMPCQPTQILGLFIVYAICVT